MLRQATHFRSQLILRRRQQPALGSVIIVGRDITIGSTERPSKHDKQHNPQQQWTMQRGYGSLSSSQIHPSSSCPSKYNSIIVATMNVSWEKNYLWNQSSWITTSSKTHDWNSWKLRSRHQLQPWSTFSTDAAFQKDEKQKLQEEGTSPPAFKGTTTTNIPKPSRKLGPTPVPTPPSAPPEENPLKSLQQASTKSIIRKGLDMTVSVFRTVVMFLVKLPGNIIFYATHPKETREAWHKLRDAAKEEAHHYWVGTKLLWADIRTARKLLGKTLEGSALTRRERKQLLRTVSDLFRLIPFSMFVLIPFMEFALPFALKMFPNMLPSTYQDSLKAEENMKRELKSRIAMAEFFQETLEELAKEQKRKASNKKKELEEAGVDLAKDDTIIEEQKESAASMLKFLEKARSGEMMPPDIIIRYAKYFQDDLTLDNMPRMQLINMCKYMSIPPYGSDAFLRFQLRHKIRILKEDDQRILWEGIDSLTKMELREACQERGMRSTGLSKDSYKRALQQWLDLSVNKDVPISLLIMSRTFFLREEMFERVPDDSGKSLSGLADAISGLDKDIVNEVILEVATKEEKISDPDVRKIKLEVVSQQNNLIAAEEEARKAAAKKKEAAGKEKAELHAAQDALEKGKVDLKLANEPTSTIPSLSSVDMATVTESIEKPKAPAVRPEISHEITEMHVEGEEEKKTKEEEGTLSADEMDAISQLVSDDPVSKERKELERIKAAMKKEQEVQEEERLLAVEMLSASDGTDEPSLRAEKMEIPAAEAQLAIELNEADQTTKESIEKIESEAAKEAAEATKITLDAHVAEKAEEKQIEARKEITAKEVQEDPVVARLKKRVQSMVDKIEVQLSETQVKIGDKLHHLDKDRDGILTREEMASALQQVLKREISFEEAMEIANTMDDNKDGVFTVEELIKWIDEHQLVKFVEEGRDADMDRIMERHSSSKHQEEISDPQEKKDKDVSGTSSS